MLQVNVAVSCSLHWHDDELCLLSWKDFPGFSQIEGKFRDNARLRHSAYLPRPSSSIVPLPPTIRRMAWGVINVSKIIGIVLFCVCPDVSAEHALSTFSSEYSHGIFICNVGTPVACYNCSAQSYGQFVVFRSEGCWNTFGNFMVTTCINSTEHFLLPTDAHNVKKRRVIKTF